MTHRRNEFEMPIVTVRASCPTCGDVDLTSVDLQVRVCTADNQGSYAFRCPECWMAVAKEADPSVVDLLVSSGVRLELWTPPAELNEEHHGLPITYDDLLDFHYALQRPGWFERLSAQAD